MNQNYFNSFAEMYKNFSENNMMFQKMPGLDMCQLSSMQKRAAEAMSSVSQVVSQNMQSMMKRQSEIMHSSANDALHFVKEVASSPSAEVGMNKSVSLMKHNFENTSSNARELMDMAMKSGMEMFDMVTKKMSENMSECSVAKKKAQ